MPEEKFSYTSELSITEKALLREEERRNRAFPTFSQAKGTNTPSESEPTEQTTEPDHPKGYTRGEFLHNLFWAAVGSGAAVLYEKYANNDDEKQAGATAEEIKFLIARNATLEDQTSTAGREMLLMEEDIFHFVTNSHELHLGGIVQLTGTYLIAHNNKDIPTPPFITDNIDGQPIMFKRGVNVLMMKEICSLNVPYTQDGFHLYNLSTLRMMPEAIEDMKEVFGI